MAFNFYHHEDFESYLETFKKEVQYQVKFMQVLDGAIISNNLPPVLKTNDLLTMVESIQYGADKMYAKQHDKVDDDEMYLTTLSYREKMRSVFKEELEKFFPKKEND